MPKTDSEIFYTRCRNLGKPWRNEDYYKWLKAKYPEHDLHHLLGSMGKLKLTDALIIPLTRIEHSKIHQRPGGDVEAFIEHLPKALELLQEYIDHLQDECQGMFEDLMFYKAP